MKWNVKKITEGKHPNIHEVFYLDFLVNIGGRTFRNSWSVCVLINWFKVPELKLLTSLECKQTGFSTSPLLRNGELEWVCCPGRDHRCLGSVGIGRGLATLHKHLASLVFFFLLWSPCYVLSISWCCYSMQALPACNLRSGDLNCQRLSGMSMISKSDAFKTAIVVKALRQNLIYVTFKICRACKIYSVVLTWRQSQLNVPQN